MNSAVKRFFIYGLMALLLFVLQAAGLFAAQDTEPEDTFFQVCAKGTAEEVRKALKDGAKINDPARC